MGKRSEHRALEILEEFYELGKGHEQYGPFQPKSPRVQNTVQELQSDGFHTFEELYQHRYILFIAIAAAEAAKWYSYNVKENRAAEKVWCSKLHEDGTMFDDSFIVGMQLPTGQVSYHLPMKEWDRVSKLLPVLERAPKWDGHTPADVLTRLEQWVYGK